ncbi:hypothetical protein BpHYR1_006845 [Brachionus plicatilis]|uniref:Uncharacterized protein n=1 Tax=Brachionus plicatilis TaxID=10195 RepID=A0A3M7P982_BRAPC|nr:hypothetical protein BpHYR1_006845 [Brachionus plicatilis]
MVCMNEVPNESISSSQPKHIARFSRSVPEPCRILDRLESLITEIKSRKISIVMVLKKSIHTRLQISNRKSKIVLARAHFEQTIFFSNKLSTKENLNPQCVTKLLGCFVQCVQSDPKIFATIRKTRHILPDRAVKKSSLGKRSRRYQKPSFCSHQKIQTKARRCPELQQFIHLVVHGQK